jgi:hypothetical protein
VTLRVFASREQGLLAPFYPSSQDVYSKLIDRILTARLRESALKPSSFGEIESGKRSLSKQAARKSLTPAKRPTWGQVKSLYR